MKMFTRHEYLKWRHNAHAIDLSELAHTEFNTLLPTLTIIGEYMFTYTKWSGTKVHHFRLCCRDDNGNNYVVDTKSNSWRYWEVDKSAKYT